MKPVTSENGGAMKILKGIGTTAFVATRVALIVGAGLVIAGTVSVIKDRFTAKSDECGTPNTENESTEEV